VTYVEILSGVMSTKKTKHMSTTLPTPEVSVPATSPLMAPPYVWTNSKGVLEWSLFWQQPRTTRACATDNATWSTCLDDVVRGALGPLKPVLGGDGSNGSAQETLFPEEIMFLTRGMTSAGFRRL
jgi:hypothetical protein